MNEDLNNKQANSKEQNNHQATPHTPPQQNTGMAIVAYILFFIPLLTESKKDPFVMYHIKQGAVIFSLAMIIWVIQMILPFSIIWSIMWLFQLTGLAILVLAILGILNAAAGKKEPLPIVGKFGDLFKF